MQEKLPQRKQLRLKEYDYSEEEYYFITICTKDRKHILSKSNKSILNQNANAVRADDPVRPKRQNYNIEEKLKLTPIGIIVEQCWKEIDKIYDNVKIDEYIIMPNHIHGIIILSGQTESSAPTKIVQGFKSVTTRECFIYKCFIYNCKQIWQRNYYEHVIRNEKKYYKVVEYIRNNPLKWEEDKYFIEEGE